MDVTAMRNPHFCHSLGVGIDHQLFGNPGFLGYLAGYRGLGYQRIRLGLDLYR